MGTRSDRGTGFGLLPPDTGNFLLNGIARLLLFLIHLERRFDPFFRGCVPYLLGDGQAVQYAFRSRLETTTRMPRLPLRPPDNYLRLKLVLVALVRDQSSSASSAAALAAPSVSTGR